MLTRPQQILLKRAQAQAALTDDEYREALAVISGMPDCRSSTDPRLSDENFDRLIAFFETVYFRLLDAGKILAVPRNPVFAERGHWANRNQRGNTSRDRYTAHDLAARIAALEAELQRVGKGGSYLSAIRARTRTVWAYYGALTRTARAAATANATPMAELKRQSIRKRHGGGLLTQPLNSQPLNLPA